MNQEKLEDKTVHTFNNNTWETEGESVSQKVTCCTDRVSGQLTLQLDPVSRRKPQSYIYISYFQLSEDSVRESFISKNSYGSILQHLKIGSQFTYVEETDLKSLMSNGRRVWESRAGEPSECKGSLSKGYTVSCRPSRTTLKEPISKGKEKRGSRDTFHAHGESLIKYF